MILEVVGSGSKGNCYILHNDNEALMLEAGVPFKSVLSVLGGKIELLEGCLVTHEHKDHSGYVKDLLDHAVRVYATEGTCQAMVPWSKSKIGVPMAIRSKMLKIGNFLIIPFETVHDAEQPCGFFIRHPEMGNLLFATDTHYLPNTFKDISNVMIECNYDEVLLAERKDIPETLKERIRGSHMSVETCIEALAANDLSKVNNIVLIHISEGDGDPESFKEKVRNATGKTVHVAEAGLSIDFNITPF